VRTHELERALRRSSVLMEVPSPTAATTEAPGSIAARPAVIATAKRRPTVDGMVNVMSDHPRK
jgi:hypothetical protein